MNDPQEYVLVSTGNLESCNRTWLKLKEDWYNRQLMSDVGESRSEMISDRYEGNKKTLGRRVEGLRRQRAGPVSFLATAEMENQASAPSS